MKDKFNELSLNTGAVYDAIKAHFLQALKEAEEKLIQIMQEEIQKTTHGGAPGRPEWRDQISDMLKEVYCDIVSDYIEVGVGIPDSLESSSLSLFMKAMIIAEGSGSAVGRAPIMAGPPGRIVWDNNLNGQHPSNAETQYLLPKEFNQRGNHFVDNAVKRMKKHFADVQDAASVSLPNEVFYGNVIVHGR